MNKTAAIVIAVVVFVATSTHKNGEIRKCKATIAQHTTVVLGLQEQIKEANKTSTLAVDALAAYSDKAQADKRALLADIADYKRNIGLLEQQVVRLNTKDKPVARPVAVVKPVKTPVKPPAPVVAPVAVKKATAPTSTARKTKPKLTFGDSKKAKQAALDAMTEKERKEYDMEQNEERRKKAREKTKKQAGWQ